MGKHLLTQITVDAVAAMIVGVLFSVGIAIWSWLAGQPLWLVPVIFVGLLALCAYLIRQYLSVRDWFTRRWVIRPQKLETTVRDWLYRSGYSIRVEPQDYAHFQFWATAELPILIAWTKSQENVLKMGSHVPLAGEGLENIANLCDSEKRQMIGDITLELLKLGVFFQLANDNQFVSILYDVPIDEHLTENNFTQHFILVRRAIVITSKLLARFGTAQ